MVDNRSAGYFGIGGSFNFKSGDPSGTATKMSDEKMGQGGEYFSNRGSEQEAPITQSPYVDQSAILRATLNSLAVMNVANVLNSKKHRPVLDEEDKITSDLKEILKMKRMKAKKQSLDTQEEDVEHY